VREKIAHLLGEDLIALWIPVQCIHYAQEASVGNLARQIVCQARDHDQSGPDQYRSEYPASYGELLTALSLNGTLSMIQSILS
jgi:hypothetical protein